jgi:hypothetical protein
MPSHGAGLRHAEGRQGLSSVRWSSDVRGGAMSVCGLDGRFPFGRRVQPTTILVVAHVYSAKLDIGQWKAS